MDYPNAVSQGSAAYVGGATVDTSGGDWAAGGGGLFRAIYVGGVAGDITVTGLDGNNVTLKAVPQGTLVPIAGTKVVKATTTATLLTALY